MKVPLADLRAQYHELKEEIDTAIRDVIESSYFIGGDKVAQLERDIAAVCGAKHGIGVASGTDALTLSLMACGVGPGDEVITTPFTFAATSEAIALVGAIPVYVDIDSCTFNLVEEKIEEKITPKTRAILPVDLYGQMCDREALTALAKKHDLCMVIDSAQAVGARQNGLPIAVHANMTTLSFYPTKNLGAYGDGGMILTSDDERADLLRSLRGHGTQGHKYHHVRVGFCSRLDALQAAVLQTKLPHLAAWNESRRRNAELYHTLLSDLTGTTEEGLQLPGHDPANYHIYHQYTVRHPRRDALQAYLKANGVDSEIYYPHPIHLQPAYAYLGYKEGDFPVAERIAREVLSLPIHPELTEEQIVYVTDLIRRFPPKNPTGACVFMKAMILAAGVGSRLDPLTRNVPKPLVPIVNRPVMEYLINLLKKHGFDEIMINTHYLGSKIEAYFGDGSQWGVKIHWAREDKLWGDAGSVKNAEAFFKDETFLVIGGDDLTDMDLTAFVETHKAKKALSSIALSLVDDPSEYGIVLMDEDDRITRFLEKPKGEVIFSNTANTGVYLFEPAVFEYIPADTFFLFGKQVFPLLLEKDLPLYGHLTTAYWKDVGNLKVYQQTHRDVLNGLVEASQPFTELSPGIWIGENVQIAPTAVLTAPLAIGDNVSIKAGAQVSDHTILGNGCIIGENATVVDCILWEGAEVMEGTHIERCVVGQDCHAKTNAAIFDGIIVPADRPETATT